MLRHQILLLQILLSILATSARDYVVPPRLPLFHFQYLSPYLSLNLLCTKNPNLIPKQPNLSLVHFSEIITTGRELLALHLYQENGTVVVQQNVEKRKLTILKASGVLKTTTTKKATSKMATIKSKQVPLPTTTMAPITPVTGTTPTSNATTAKPSYGFFGKLGAGLWAIVGRFFG